MEPPDLQDVFVGELLGLLVEGRIHREQLFRIEAAGLGPGYAPEIGNALPQLDVRPSAGHVGGDGDGPGNARLRHDLRLALVVLGVQDVVLHPPALEHPGQGLGHLNVRRPHQHRELHLVQALNLVHEGHELFPFGAEDEVVPVVPDDGAVGWDDQYLQIVDLVELVLLRFRRPRHSRQLVVHPEVVLDGDGGQSLGLPPDLHPFLGLHGLVQAITPAPPGHLATRELVHDDDGSFFPDDVLLVLVEEGIGLQELMDDMHLLALGGVRGLQLLDGYPFLLHGFVLVLLDGPDGFGQIRDHERIRIVGRELLNAHVREVDVVPLLIHGEEELLVDLIENLLPHVVRFHPLRQLLESGLVGEHLQELPVFRRSPLHRQELLAGSILVLLVPALQELLGFRNQLIRDAALLPVEI